MSKLDVGRNGHNCMDGGRDDRQVGQYAMIFERKSGDSFSIEDHD